MGLLKRLFGRQGRGVQSTQGSRKIVNQGDSDPPVAIDPQSITYAFVALTHSDAHHSNTAAKTIADLNRASQPSIWNTAFKAKFVSFTADPGMRGYPDVTAIPVALENAGLVQGSTIVINDFEVSFDGGRTRSRIYAGFAFPDQNPRIILPRAGGCVPA